MRREVGAMAKVVSAKAMRSMEERLDARKPCHNLHGQNRRVRRREREAKEIRLIATTKTSHADANRHLHLHILHSKTATAQYTLFNRATRTRPE